MSAAPHRYAYLHGFASGARSRKGRLLAEHLAAEAGLAVERPDLNRPSFARLSPAAMVDALDALDAAGEGPWAIMGSSYGGWLTAYWGSLRPGRIARAVLLCPAFGIGERWPAILGAEAVARWRREGFLTVPDGAGNPTDLHYRFFEESGALPGAPSLDVPTLVVHGVHDDRVPIESSRAWVAEQPDAELLEVDDGHDLLATFPGLLPRLGAFLRGGG